jgi:purine-binding chemotaxis protein CheW
MTAITRVPKAQHYYRGVINMRGEVVPVMSLRRRMSLEDDVFTNASRILIVKPEASALLGFIVDEVLGVVVLQSSEVEKVAYSREEKDMYINGIGKTDGQLISLLDLKRVIGEREFED